VEHDDRSSPPDRTGVERRAANRNPGLGGHRAFGFAKCLHNGCDANDFYHRCNASAQQETRE
jgi:hypothetical protein